MKAGDCCSQFDGLPVSSPKKSKDTMRCLGRAWASCPCPRRDRHRTRKRKVLSGLLLIFKFNFIFGRPEAYGVPGLGIRSEPHLEPMSLTHCTGLGREPVSQHSRDAANPIAPQWELPIWTFFFFFVFCLHRATPAAYGGSLPRGLIGAIAAGLHQSHSNVRSKPHLRPTPQLTAVPDP